MYYSHSSRSKAPTSTSSPSSPNLYLAKKKRDSVKHSDSSKSADKDLFVNNNQRRSALSRSSSKSSVPSAGKRDFEEETCESGQMVRPSLEVIDKVYGKQVG